MEKLNRFNISKASYADLSQIVDVHICCFPNSFSTAMKKNLLFDFYQLYFKKNQELFFVAKENEKTVGFVMGYFGSQQNLTKLFIRKHFVRFFLRCLVQLLKFDKRAWKKIFHKKQKITYINEKYLEVDNNKRGNILSIAVLPDFRKNGLGKSLMLSFEKELTKLGFLYCTLCTGINNSARILYEKSGYVINKISDGVHYIKEL